MHYCPPQAPENPAAERLVAPVITVKTDDVTARGQVEELHVINFIHIEAEVFLSLFLQKQHIWTFTFVWKFLTYWKLHCFSVR